MLVYAIVFINLAFVFYTIAVWAEKRQAVLRPWHLLMFWAGLVFDTVGTTNMSILAGTDFKFNFHGITGLLAILLMMFHTLWATRVLVRNDEKMKMKFHRLSLVVWLIWLIPFISGAIFGMAG